MIGGQEERSQVLHWIGIPPPPRRPPRRPPPDPVEVLDEVQQLTVPPSALQAWAKAVWETGAAVRSVSSTVGRAMTAAAKATTLTRENFIMIVWLVV